jgi:hypothetical protein
MWSYRLSGSNRCRKAEREPQASSVQALPRRIREKVPSRFIVRRTDDRSGSSPPGNFAWYQSRHHVQDACNLCGVPRTFAELCVELKNWPHQPGDCREKRDAIVKMWISKMEHLTGLEQSMSQVDHDIVCELAQSAQVRIVEDPAELPGSLTFERWGRSRSPGPGIGNRHR